MRNRVSNLLWGLAFIIVGVGFAGNAMNWWNFRLFFDGWWTLFIIIPSIISIIQNGPRTGNIIGVCIGGLLLLSAQDYIDGNLLGDMMVPLILVIIGVGIIFRNSINKNRHKYNENREFAQTGENFPHLTAVFGSRKANYQNEVFTGATINAIFGGVELDLRDAIMEDDIVIDASVIFGGADIWVPRDVKVVVSNMPIFGGVSNKTRNNNGEARVTLYLNGICMFGGIDIK